MSLLTRAPPQTMSFSGQHQETITLEKAVVWAGANTLKEVETAPGFRVVWGEGVMVAVWGGLTGVVRVTPWARQRVINPKQIRSCLKGQLDKEVPHCYCFVRPGSQNTYFI